MEEHSSHRGMAEHPGHHDMRGQSGYNGIAGNSGHGSMISMGHSPFLQLQTSASLLVPEWNTESVYGLTGAMLAAVAASVTYECLSEYLQHIRRKAVTRKDGPKCCGTPVVTFSEKLGQSVIQMLRVVFAYFMMLCVMTMNVWLLVAVVVGAFVGYGVGKPLVANRIEDSFTSHGYDAVTAKIYRHGNKSERSKSWRYQPIVKTNTDLKTKKIESDDIFLEGEDELDSDSKYSKNASNGADIVWIRRSTEELRPRPSEISDVFEDSDIQLRSQDDALNFDSIRSEGRHSSRSSNRFRSTSKIINDSFRSYKSESEMRKHSTSANTSLNVSFDSQVMDNTDRRHRDSKSSLSKVKRTTSATSTSRFKPVSREIMRQMSFNEDLS